MKYQFRYNKYTIYSSIIFVFFILFVSVFVATRDVSVGIDTQNYLSNFRLIVDFNYVSELFEPGFQFLTYVISIFSTSSVFYLYAISVFLSISFLVCVCLFYRRYSVEVLIPYHYFIMVCFMMLYSSNFFLTANINGIRQGLSAPLIFIAYFFVLEKKFLLSAIFSLLAVSFHYSSVLFIFPFVLIFFNVRFVIYFFVISSSMYFFGVFEFLVQKVSAFTGFPIYEMIKNYSSTGLYEGFNVGFFLYSISPLVVYCGVRFYNQRLKSSTMLEDIFKVYTSLIFPYFVFGFAGYANRYAFTAWLFMPLFYAFLISILVKKDIVANLLYFGLFFIFSFVFIFKMYNW